MNIFYYNSVLEFQILAMQIYNRIGTVELIQAFVTYGNGESQFLI